MLRFEKRIMAGYDDYEPKTLCVMDNQDGSSSVIAIGEEKVGKIEWKVQKEANIASEANKVFFIKLIESTFLTMENLNLFRSVLSRDIPRQGD